jgi:hypothetical protein
LSLTIDRSLGATWLSRGSNWKRTLARNAVLGDDLPEVLEGVSSSLEENAKKPGKFHASNVGLAK